MGLVESYTGLFGDVHTARWLLVMQGLSVPFACVGSSDPVRVLRLYTTNTLDVF